MKPQFIRAGWITIGLTLLIFLGLEFYLRNNGYNISFDDSESLFSNSRRKVYLPKDDATVLIGSSRMKYDLSTETWNKETGETAVQLANVGSSPTPVLKDLANDENFKGKLIIDATEGLFFDIAGWSYSRPNEMLKYCQNETPSQRFGYYINDVLESNLVFLDKESFSLNALLSYSNIVPPRSGIREFPPYPVNFSRLTRDRMQYMDDGFIKDSSQYNAMRRVWMGLAMEGSKRPPIPENMIDSFLLDTKVFIDKIKARGGDVIFIRPPSSGPLWQGEQMGFPRDKFWDKTLRLTNCKGIHFADYPETSKFDCPEYSHITKTDATIYTKHLVEIIRKEIGWKI